MKRIWVWLLLVVTVLVKAAEQDFDYALKPVEIAPATYVLVGKREDFNPGNGGNIMNTGFVVTATGVVVVDTGPTRRYGEQLRSAIRRVTDQPIVKVFNTHHHPDHILGNQAFADVGISALPATIKGEQVEGAAFASNVYRMTLDWAKDTELSVATRPIAETGFTLGGHDFELLALAGHSDGDLVVLDRTTGVLFSGDLVFHDRAPTMPHANIARWLAALDRLDDTQFRFLVPGHGEVVAGKRPIAETRDYLKWLSDHLEKALAAGDDIIDVLGHGPPARFATFAVIQDEYRRSVLQLYPRMEAERLPKSSATR